MYRKFHFPPIFFALFFFSRKSETVPDALNGKQFTKKPLARKNSHAITTISPEAENSW